MWIRKIILKNWSCHEDSVFDFPLPSARGRNVVLVGAKNGAGKTSLLEAITLCLFGVQGIGYLARGNTAPGSEEVKYRAFLDGVFCKNADALTMSTRIDFLKQNGDELSLERTWRFAPGNPGNRQYEGVEEVKIWEKGRPLWIPRVEDKDEVHRNFVARHLIPPSLVPFFFFDSAQVQRIARSDQSDQVRIGIEGILGIPILEELADDLRKYEQDCRRSTKHIGGKTIKAAADALEKFEAEKGLVEKACASLDEKIKSTEEEHGKLLDDFQKIGGESVEQMGKLRQELGGKEANLHESRKKLSEILADEFALALAGRDLLRNTSAQLEAEKLLNSWENDKRSSGNKFSAFASNLEDAKTQLSPPITGAQWEQLREKIRQAWDKLWYPPPSGVADSIMHDFLSDADRDDAIARFGKLHTAKAAIARLRVQITAMETEVHGIKKKINAISMVGDVDKAKALKAKLEKCSEALKILHSRKDGKNRELNAINGQIAAKRQEHARLIDMEKEAAPQLKRVSDAGKSVDLIGKIIAGAYPIHIKGVAKAMLSSYVAMANKNVVEKIEIDNNCVVRLLNEDGRNLNDVNPSHGESQIFALALIAAIVNVSNKLFPFVIDTPLGNLDSVHRPNFLKYYSQMENQVILLSTDEEVRKREFALLESRIAKKVLIEHDAARQCSVVKDGYFEEIDR